jgi:hypothetical protein
MGGEPAAVSHWPINSLANPMNRSTSALADQAERDAHGARALAVHAQQVVNGHVGFVFNCLKHDESSVPVRPSAISPPPGLQKHPVRSEMFAALACCSTMR